MVWANALRALAHTIPQSRVRRSRTTAEIWLTRRMLWDIPRSPGAAEPHHRRDLANAEDALGYSTIPGCGGVAPPPSFGECGGCFGIFHDPRVRRSRTTARREH